MILAIPGSLKRSSMNSAVLRATTLRAARDRVVVDIDDSVRQPPHFDPDLEGTPPDVVLRFRARCKSAAGRLFAVSEYACGRARSFQNGLDWTVGNGSLYRKPVALLDVAPPWPRARPGSRALTRSTQLPTASPLYGGAVRTAMDTALALHDQDTADLFAEVSRSTDKHRCLGEAGRR
jgi:hypothetical protein